MKFVTLYVVFLFVMVDHSYCQFKKMALTKEEVKARMQCHYSSREEHGSLDLYLYKDSTFNYSFASCLDYGFSTGRWTQQGKVLTFISDYDSNNLPIAVRYRQKEPKDSFIKKIDFIRDNNGNPSFLYGLLINNDTTACYYGDYSCYGDITTIDSVKVKLPSGVSSEWVKVIPNFDVMEISLQPQLDFEKYVIFKEQYRIERNGTIVRR
jgi:hypothetical protein